MKWVMCRNINSPLITLISLKGRDVNYRALVLALAKKIFWIAEFYSPGDPSDVSDEN